MAKNELFKDIKNLRGTLTEQERTQAVDDIIRNARYALRYFYTLNSAAGILRMSYDEIQTLVSFYDIDAVKFLTVVRIPWWSLCEYLIDPANDLKQSLTNYLNSLPKRAKSA